MATVMMTGVLMNRLLQAFPAACNDSRMAPRERQLTYEDLVRLVELIKSTSHFSEFRLKVGEIEVSLRRSNGAARPLPAPAREAPIGAALETPKISADEGRFAPGLHLVRAPMVGTFYRASAPGAAPYVTVGQKVEAGSTVCIIEVMKLMNSIEAGVRGVVREVLVENACAVAHGEVLFAIEPQ
jgi:acetyl-CoA carboxylase biotin carboxyl carrier protein